MAWSNCDVCGGNEYSDENPFAMYREQRPSDKSEMCCTFAGHHACIAPNSTLPDIGPTSGVATSEQWEKWIESPEAMKAGFCFLT